MDKNSLQQNVFIQNLGKEIVVYNYGSSDKKYCLFMVGPAEVPNWLKLLMKC